MGALSQTTLAQLRSLGLTVESARDVSGSQHVSDGQVVTTPQPATPSTNIDSDSNKTGSSNWSQEERSRHIEVGDLSDGVAHWQ